MNMKRFNRQLFIVMLLFGGSPAAFAGTGDIAAGIKGGTLGIGGEVTVGVLPGINFRTGYQAFNYSGDSRRSDIDYDYKLKLKNIPLLVDWQPLPITGFRITAGAMINNTKVDATGKAQGTYDIGGTTYSAAEIGTLTGKIDFNSFAPYAGIGWGNAVNSHFPLTFSCDIGVLFQGTPRVSLAATGPIASDPTFQAELAEEKASIKDKTDGFRYYPVVSFGVSYKF
ncbi:MAG: hypothetical protein HGA56_08390 [Chlorobiaceae bacterium]|nr:hypothetical protein [Chlorobiaceae bacterium]